MTDDRTDNRVKLFHKYGTDVWPADVAKYYDVLDKERGFPPAKLILGYDLHKKPKGDKR